MKDIYSSSNSDYMKMTQNWHIQDSAWKAKQIAKIIKKNNLSPDSIVEVGCGVGEILFSLNTKFEDNSIEYVGYDIAKDALKIADQKNISNVKFFCRDFTVEQTKVFDLLLMIDVFEHVPDYIGFIEKCKQKATYKVFHIPLDIHVSSLMRNRLSEVRQSVGHLHYFTKETALATLKDTGLEIIDYNYTKGSEISTNTKTKFANLLRSLLFRYFPDITVKLVGGYSLLVLAK